jgi:hypothetical protein
VYLLCEKGVVKVHPAIVLVKSDSTLIAGKYEFKPEKLLGKVAQLQNSILDKSK